MVMRRRVRTQHFAAASVQPALLRQLWQIRHDHFPVDHGRTQQQDYADFAAYFQRDRREAIVFFRGDEPVGFYLNSHDVVEHHGRRAVLVSIEFTYMLPGYRGHPAFILAGFRMFFRLLARHPLTPIYYVGYVFPNSFAFVNASFGRVFTLQEDPPAFERHLLTWYARNAGGQRWDEHRQVARYRNRPPDEVHLARKSAELIAGHERFERLVPTWREGDALVVLAPADLRAFGSVVRRAARRVWRELARPRAKRVTARGQ